ncbi:TetR/AcrR family transcriptional regulator [Nocardia higoensis]|uniref:TetR/AcrR family transcriptional regulator n=1 Tax=Nocardia higoensis TaxID=228599 RepID=UPI0002ED98CD|nr:TetR/AcrR family transcriptional regulator [Nocardia higoensis]
MAADAPDRPRRRNATATRQALLTAARSLLAERGATQTTSRDIAAAAGVNQALINRYFGSKENLFVEAVRTNEAGMADIVTTVSLPDIPARMLHEVLEVTDSGRGATAMLAGVVNNETITAVIRDIVESTLTTKLGDRLGDPDGGLRAELLNALVVGVTVMRKKIGSPALAAADVDVIARYVTAMAEPLLRD